MRMFFQRLGTRLARFMYGRYGYDTLSQHLMVLALGIWLLSLFVWPEPLLLLYLAVFVYVHFRVFSKNIGARRRELERYLRLIRRPQQWLRLQKNKWRDRKTHRYFTCRCGAALRVPRGRGNITVHCPKCGNRFDKTT